MAAKFEFEHHLIWSRFGPDVMHTTREWAWSNMLMHRPAKNCHISNVWSITDQLLPFQRLKNQISPSGEISAGSTICSTQNLRFVVVSYTAAARSHCSTKCIGLIFRFYTHHFDSFLSHTPEVLEPSLCLSATEVKSVCSVSWVGWLLVLWWEWVCLNVEIFVDCWTYRCHARIWVRGSNFATENPSPG